MFIILVILCIVLPKEEIYYFIFLLQTLGLLFLIEVIWLPIHEYILSSLTYLMIFSKISYIYKGNDTDSFKDLLKSQIFFKTSNVE